MPVNVPEQLHRPDFRFVKLLSKDKKPFEKEWQSKNNYLWNQVEFQQHLSQDGNYGVLCGNGLIVVDSDTPELNEAMSKMPKTFTVKTGNPDMNHRHYYFLCSDCDGKVIITKNGKHFGEIQSKGSQVVGAGSVHPNGRYYLIYDNSEIAEIKFDQLKEAIKDLVSPDRFEQKVVVIPSATSKTIPDSIKKLIKEGSEEGNRNKDTWIIVKTLFNLGYDSDIIFEKAFEFNKNCKKPRQDFEVKTHVRQLLANPSYLAEKVSFEDIEKRQIGNEEILRMPDLFNLIVSEFDKKIEGEKDNKRAIFLNLCGIFVENHQTASYNLCVNSESGAGKDYTVSNILKLFPKELVESKTRISPTAFTYWHNAKFEPDWNWDGKICYLQDISNSILNSDTFKTMVSDGSSSIIVIEHRAIDIEIKGKPVVVITTATANPKNEMLRRFPILTLDESVNQTKAIMRRQSQMAKLGKVPQNEYSEDITNSLRMLKRVKVKIPFADILDKAYPPEHIIMRTHFQRLLDLIKCSCALHQLQRKTDEDGYVIAEPQDYEIATTALKQTTQNALMIPLTKNQQKFLELCKKEYEREWFSAPEIAGKCSFLGQQSVYDYLEKLQELFFETDSVREEDSKKPVKKYRLRPVVNISIPTFEECQNIGNDVIDGNDRNDGIYRNDNLDTTKTQNNSINSINSTQNSL